MRCESYTTGTKWDAVRNLITYSFHELFDFSFRQFWPKSSQTWLQFFISDCATLISIHVCEHYFKTFNFLFRYSFGNNLDEFWITKLRWIATTKRCKKCSSGGNMIVQEGKETMICWEVTAMLLAWQQRWWSEGATGGFSDSAWGQMVVIWNKMAISPYIERYTPLKCKPSSSLLN